MCVPKLPPALASETRRVDVPKTGSTYGVPTGCSGRETGVTTTAGSAMPTPVGVAVGVVASVAVGCAPPEVPVARRYTASSKTGLRRTTRCRFIIAKPLSQMQFPPRAPPGGGSCLGVVIALAASVGAGF